MKQKKAKKGETSRVARATGASLGQVTEALLPEETKMRRAEQEQPERREAAEKYEEIKQKVLNREKDNFSEIILVQDKEIPGSKKKRWWKILGHSAIMLKYEVGKVHHLKFTIHRDDDFGPRSEEGAISVPDLEEFLSKMARRGMTEVKRGKEVVVVKMGYSIDRERYTQLLATEEHLVEHAGKMIRPVVICPALDKVTKEMDKQVHEMVRKMDRQSQDAFANKMEGITTQISVKLTRVARGSYDFEEFLDELEDAKEDLWGYVGIIMDRRAFELEKVAQVGEAIRSVEMQLETERKLLEKEKLKERAKIKNESDAKAAKAK